MAPPKRQRRTAEEARRAILDAAEKRLGEGGPDGIRLQQIAADVGVSHPAILHHFGSREGLIEAVVQRAMSTLEADLIAAIRRSTAGAPNSSEAIETAFRVMVDRGHARVLAWLSLSGRGPPAGEHRVRSVAEVAYSTRQRLSGEVPTAEFEDNLFRTMLVALTLVGEAVAGPGVRQSAGLDGDPDAPARFREWLSRLIVTPVTDAPGTRGRPSKKAGRARD